MNLWIRTRAYWVALALLRFAGRGSGHHYETKLVWDGPAFETITFSDAERLARAGLRKDPEGRYL